MIVKKRLHWLWSNLEECVNVALLALLVVIVFIQVFMRRFVGRSLQWSEEATRYIFVWMTLVGFSLGVKHRRHIRMEILYERLGAKGRFGLDLLSNVIFLLFCLLNVVLGIRLVASFLEFGQVSPALNIPMQYIYLSAPLCLSITAIRILQNIWEDIQTYRHLDQKGESEE